jgi:hypothetical protein
MADENKNTEINVEKEVPRGDRGEVGTPTAALTVKQLWHAECHVLMDVGDKKNPRKQQWVKKQGALSLKKFARKLAGEGNQTVKDWFDSKKGALNAERNDKNKTRITLERQASKAARRKSSQKSGASAAAK